jgi:hypothetical protein
MTRPKVVVHRADPGDDYEGYLGVARQVFGRPDLLGDRSVESPHDAWSRHYWATMDGRGVACARLVLGADLPSATILRRHGFADPGPADAEPSKYGLIESLQHTRSGMLAFNRLVGQVFLDALDDYPDWVMTAFYELLTALRHLPFIIDGPVHFGPEDGGPADRSRPVWMARLQVPSAIAVVQAQEPELAGIMFPGFRSLVGRPGITPIPELAELIAHNRQVLPRQLADWKAAHPSR